jgi:hypothetical protein
MPSFDFPRQIKPDKCTLVSITQRTALGIQQILECDVARQRADVDLIVQSDVLPTIVKRFDRPTHFIQSCCQVFLLPLPKDTVNVAMMTVKERVCVRQRVRASSSTASPLYSSHSPPGLSAASAIVP